MSVPQPGIRLDKWLWHARFFKTRTLAAKMVACGSVRVNSLRVVKPAFSVKIGDGLTFVQGEQVRIIKVVAMGERRGPAPEAQALYEDLTPPPPPKTEVPAPTETDRKGRPTKKDRRALDDFRRDGP